MQAPTYDFFVGIGRYCWVRWIPESHGHGQLGDGYLGLIHLTGEYISYLNLLFVLEINVMAKMSVALQIELRVRSCVVLLFFFIVLLLFVCFFGSDKNGYAGKIIE